MQNNTEDIKRAGLEQKLLNFSYTDGKGITTNRTVEPYEFYTGGDGFYGHDVDKNAIRHFKILNMGNIKMSDTPFEPRYPMKIT